MLKSFPLHGVGHVTFYDYVTGREVLRITRQESSNWTFSYEDQDVFGGNDLDAFDNFETSRAQSVEFVENVFDVRQMEAATGKRVVYSLSVPISEQNEGKTVPATGPFTVTLNFASAAEAGTYRVRFNDTWEDFAPVPTVWSVANLREVENAATGVFNNAEPVSVRITSVLTSGIESVCTAAVVHVIAGPAAKSDLYATAPDNVITTPTGMPLFDVNELAGFNFYVTVGAGVEYKSNASPVAAGTEVMLTVSPGAGAMSPDTTPTTTGQFTVAAGVITFAAVDAGKAVLVDYVWRTSGSSAECSVLDMLKTCLRPYLRAIWRMNYRSTDGTMRGMEMDIFKLKYSGDYSLDMARADATSHSMMFKILDPERPDKKVVSWKLFPLPADTGCN